MYISLVLKLPFFYHSSINDKRYFNVYMYTYVYKGLPCKRTTTSRFTEHQLFQLKKRFKSDPYIKGMEKKLIAKNLSVTQTAIKDWFYLERLRLQQPLANKDSNATV